MPNHAPITQKTWLALFDGGRAAVFENEGFDDAPNLRFVFGSDNDNPATRDQGSDKPGRYPTPMGGRASVEQTDFHDRAEHKFVEDFAHEIETAAAHGRFDRLVVIAPAKMLHEFRGRLKRAADRIAGEHAGDFVRSPIDTIERAFKEALNKKKG